MNKIIITIENQTVNVVRQGEQIEQGEHWPQPELVEDTEGRRFHQVIPVKVCMYTKKDGSKRYIKYVPLAYLLEHNLVKYPKKTKKNKPDGSFYAWDFDRVGIRLLYHASFSTLEKERWNTKILLPDGYFVDNGLRQGQED
jgi:hypothetical protein